MCLGLAALSDAQSHSLLSVHLPGRCSPLPALGPWCLQPPLPALLPSSWVETGCIGGGGEGKGALISDL